MSVPIAPPAPEPGAILAALRAPFPPEEIRWKVQRLLGSSLAQIVGYLDARSVYDRLNTVAGTDWQTSFDLIERLELPAGPDGPARALYRFSCRLTVCGVTREDVGEGDDPKAAYSDSAKRAGVQFGIGLAVYRLPRIVLRVGERDGELRRDRRNRPYVDDRCAEALRRAYVRWLAGDGLPYAGRTEVPGLASPVSDPREDQPGDDPLAPPLRPVDRIPGRSPYGHETRRLLAALLWGKGLGELTEEQRKSLQRGFALARLAELSDELLALAVRSALEQPDRGAARKQFRDWLVARPRRSVQRPQGASNRRA